VNWRRTSSERGHAGRRPKPDSASGAWWAGLPDLPGEACATWGASAEAQRARRAPLDGLRTASRRRSVLRESSDDTSIRNAAVVAEIHVTSRIGGRINTSRFDEWRLRVCHELIAVQLAGMRSAACPSRQTRRGWNLAPRGRPGALLMLSACTSKVEMPARWRECQKPTCISERPKEMIAWQFGPTR